jgi:hypothetical protein
VADMGLDGSLCDVEPLHDLLRITHPFGYYWLPPKGEGENAPHRS